MTGSGDTCHGRTVIGPRQPRAAPYLRPDELWRSLWRNRHVAAHVARRQVQSRHRGSHLGVLWTVVHPLLLLGVYTLVFTELLPVGVEPGQRLDFVLRVFCGLVLFGVFAETVQRAPTAIVGHANYVKKCVFPLEALPVADLWASAWCGALNVGVLTAVVALAGAISWTALLFPLVLPPLLLLTLGLAWLLAALGVYVRDLSVSIGVLVTVAFFLTPIVYRAQDVPTRWQWLMECNPMAVVVETGRATLLGGTAPDWTALLVAYLLAFGVAQLGFAWFQATKRGFADVL